MNKAFKSNHTSVGDEDISYTTWQLNGDISEPSQVIKDDEFGAVKLSDASGNVWVRANYEIK